MRTALVVVLAAAACGGGAQARPAPISNTQVAAPAEPPRRVEDDLALIPIDADAVIGIDVAKVRQSELFDAYAPQLLSRFSDDLARFEKECGFDPVSKLGRITIGMDVPQGGGDPQNMTVIVHGFERDATIACLRTAAERHTREGNPRQAIVDGAHVELIENGELDVRFMFLDSHTALLMRRHGVDATKAQLAAAAAGQEKGLLASPTFAALLPQVRTDAAMFYVINGHAQVFKSTGLPFELKVLFGALEVDRTMHGDLSFRLPDEEQAQTFLGLGKMGMAELESSPAGPIAKAIRMTSKGTDVTLSFDFTRAHIDHAIELAR